MGRVARCAIVAGSLVACLASGVAVAQDKPADNMAILREKVRADKKVVVASALELTEGEAKAFWPVYNAYQSDMVGHYDRLLALIDTYARAYDAMTDETATSLLARYLALERDHLALLNAYVSRFQKTLPAKKVARLYQVENKIRALVNYELAREIPLVK
ncbi:MAG: hypothetical protein ACREM3_15745 [Candidatus Rokuibacteriota bacterium]